ncbi:hypothetical protein SF23_15610, partial [Streptomyces sp. MBRL 10]
MGWSQSMSVVMRLCLPSCRRVNGPHLRANDRPRTARTVRKGESVEEVVQCPVGGPGGYGADREVPQGHGEGVGEGGDA